MKKLPKIFLMLMFSFTFCSQTYAYGDQWSPNEIFELYSDNSSKFNVLIYFNGVGNGFFWQMVI
jgi:hypothetical protein